MKLRDLLNESEEKEYSKLILSDIYNIGVNDLINYLDREIEDNIYDDYQNKIKLLKNGKPIQYVIGNVNFYGLKLKVDENVLIPRFETEQLVSSTINYIEKYFDTTKELKVLDLCSGSGAIGLTIKKKYPNFSVDLIDISTKALDISRENAKNLNLDVNFIQNDLLENLNNKYDIIISNPPYIKDDEQIEDIVYKNEPHLALFAGPKGLDYYQRIIKKIKNNLNEKFLIAFEIGYNQKKALERLTEQNLNNVNYWCLKDFNEYDRMFFIKNV